jgi:hypothetical protein
MLHSNPGDYAWGQGGLDAVITQVDTMPTSVFSYQWHIFLLMDLKC